VKQQRATENKRIKMSREVPIATAVPVHDPVKNTVSATEIIQPSNSPLSQETAEYGICRRCRREFRRAPGVNEGQAQYFRCSECETHRGADLFMGSCSLC